MKAVEVMFDETLLSRLDEDQEVRRVGRSAFLRRLVVEYLSRRREAAIDAQYRKAYADGGGLGPELDGWEDEAVWPDE